jgi:hypothetical protein
VNQKARGRFFDLLITVRFFSTKYKIYDMKQKLPTLKVVVVWHTRRDSIPFAQWSPEALGACFILPFALTNSSRFRFADSPPG